MGKTPAQRILLKAATSWVGDALSTKDIVQSMTYYRIEAGEVCATNGRLVAGHPLDIDGSYLVPGRELEKLLGRMDAEPTIEPAGDGAILIKAGRLRGTVTTLPLDQWDYPGVDDADWTKLPDGLLPAMAALRPFVSDNATQAWAMGMAILGGWAYATNNVVLAGVPLPKLKKLEGIVPVWAIDFVLSRMDGLREWAWADDYIAFRWESGAWMRAALLAGKFHARAAELVDQAAGAKPTQTISADFRAAVERLADLSDEGGMAIYSDRIETSSGRARVEFDVECEVPKDHEHSLWSAQFLAPVVRIATHWQPASWPQPAAFKGEHIVGYIAGRNQ